MSVKQAQTWREEKYARRRNEKAWWRRQGGAGENAQSKRSGMPQREIVAWQRGVKAAAKSAKAAWLK